VEPGRGPKDTHSLDQLLAENFIYVDIDGSLIKNKAEFLASVTSLAEHIESIRGESMLSQVHGDTVIVTGVYHEKGTLNGKPYLHHGRFTDTGSKNAAPGCAPPANPRWYKSDSRACGAGMWRGRSRPRSAYQKRPAFAPPNKPTPFPHPPTTFSSTPNLLNDLAPPTGDFSRLTPFFVRSLS
jgi:hypothetical protein